MFRGLLVAFVLLLQAGCSTLPQVHLFSRYLSADQLTDLQSSLAASEATKDWQVHVTDQAFPRDLNGNTIITSPFALNSKQLNQLKTLLTDLDHGYIAERFVGSGKHSYTKEHLGIYLFGSGFAETTRQLNAAITNEFSATGCLSAIYADLNIQDDNTINLTMGFDQEGKDREVQDAGRWWTDSGYLFIELKDINPVVFQLDDIKETTPYGLRQGWRLTPVQGANQVNYCQFEYTQVVDY